MNEDDGGQTFDPLSPYQKALLSKKAAEFSLAVGEIVPLDTFGSLVAQVQVLRLWQRRRDKKRQRRLGPASDGRE